MNNLYKPLLGFFAAVALVTSMPTYAQADVSTADQQTEVSKFVVEKVSAEFPVPFNVFTQRLEKLVGRYNPQDTILAATDHETGLNRVKASQGADDLMLFHSDDHGALWALIGEHPKKALRYYIGNPLIAIQMTRRNLGAALYAPLTLVVYEVDGGKTAVFYDRPSTLFGQFHDPEIDKVGKALDIKLSALLATAGKPQ